MYKRMLRIITKVHLSNRNGHESLLQNSKLKEVKAFWILDAATVKLPQRSPNFYRADLLWASIFPKN
jgi:hypothetical protein